MEMITKVMPIIDPFIGKMDMKIIKHFTISQHTHTHVLYVYSSYFLCNRSCHKVDAHYRCFCWIKNMKMIEHFNVSKHTSSIYILLTSYVMEILTKLMPIIDASIIQTNMKIIKGFNVSQHTHIHTSSMYILLISYAIEVIAKFMPTTDAHVMSDNRVDIVHIGLKRPLRL